MHVGVFQALPGRSRGLQRPPGASRGLQGAPGGSRRLQNLRNLRKPQKNHHKHGFRGGFLRDLNALRLDASANKTKYIWAFKGVCGAFSLFLVLPLFFKGGASTPEPPVKQSIYGPGACAELKACRGLQKFLEASRALHGPPAAPRFQGPPKPPHQYFRKKMCLAAYCQSLEPWARLKFDAASCSLVQFLCSP